MSLLATNSKVNLLKKEIEEISKNTKKILALTEATEEKRVLLAYKVSPTFIAEFISQPHTHRHTQTQKTTTQRQIHTSTHNSASETVIRITKVQGNFLFLFTTSSCVAGWTHKIDGLALLLRTKFALFPYGLVCFEAHVSGNFCMRSSSVHVFFMDHKMFMVFTTSKFVLCSTIYRETKGYMVFVEDFHKILW